MFFLSQSLTLQQTNSGYSTNPINKTYFENIENWLKENSSKDLLKTFFDYRGNEDYDSIDNNDIQNYIFGTDDNYNLVPIKITAIEDLSDLTEIDVNTLSTVYKYLLRINGASEKLQTMLNSLKNNIEYVSNGLT